VECGRGQLLHGVLGRVPTPAHGASPVPPWDVLHTGGAGEAGALACCALFACMSLSQACPHAVYRDALLLLLLRSLALQRECAAGRYGSAWGLSSEVCSGLCSPGYECPTGSTSPTQQPCPLGSYCVLGQRILCPPGTLSVSTFSRPPGASLYCIPSCCIGRYGNQTLAVSSDACLPCPGGTFSAVRDLCPPLCLRPCEPRPIWFGRD
jgi:hypothetical protein